MSYSPTPGSNIANIYGCVLDREQSADEIYAVTSLKFPRIPKGSIKVHLKFLVSKKLVDQRGDFYWRTANSQATPKPKSESKPKSKPKSKSKSKSRPQCILEYCQQRIGKKITSLELRASCCEGKVDSIPNNILNKLEKMGVLSRIDGTRPREFLVLPEIKTIDRVNYNELTVSKPTIERIEPRESMADLSIGQILTEYVSLKEENRRIREALQRIAHELYQIGEVGD